MPTSYGGGFNFQHFPCLMPWDLPNDNIPTGTVDGSLEGQVQTGGTLFSDAAMSKSPQEGGRVLPTRPWNDEVFTHHLEVKISTSGKVAVVEHEPSIYAP